MLEALEARALLATFTVSNTLDAGVGSLRQAILNSNATPGRDAIRFALNEGAPGTTLVADQNPLASGAVSQFVISLQSSLPIISDPVEILGYSQPGSATNYNPDKADDEETDIAVIKVRVDGSQAGAGANGFVLHASGCVVAGLSLTGFDGAAIVVGYDPSGPAGSDPAVGNTVWGNFIGVSDFLEIVRYLDAQQNVIGVGRAPVVDPSQYPYGATPANEPAVDRPWRGYSFPNRDGILIYSANNRIGGTLPPARNVIQGNFGDGVRMVGEFATGNLVESNFVLDNLGTGVLVNSSNNFIGEPVGDLLAGGGNVISGNGNWGLVIRRETGKGNASGNVVANNEIGTDVGLPDLQTAETRPPTRGMVPRANQGGGVLIDGAPGNSVGTSQQFGRNAIAGNQGDGLVIRDRLEAPNGPLFVAENNRIRQNDIGFHDRGDIIAIMPNATGVYITSPRNIVGGDEAGERNRISYNGRYGIHIQGTSARGNSIRGNYIGTVGGGEDAGNTLSGIFIDAAPDARIGGLAAGSRNVISGNHHGVLIQGAGAIGASIVGNLIGTTSDGEHDLGDAINGVWVVDAPKVTIGGTDPAARNVISGNDRGIVLEGTGTTEAVVQGNWIGPAASSISRVVGNAVLGIRVTGGASLNLIGGTTAGSGNVVAYNVYNGIVIESGTRNSILGNSISANGGPGIDLGADGVTPNDPVPDADAGPNNLQNKPQLERVTRSGAVASVSGQLSSTPNAVFTVQFFASSEADPSTFGEGEFYLGSLEVTTDTAGLAVFNYGLTSPLGSDLFVTATATDALGNTSEFSNAVSSDPARLNFAFANARVFEASGPIVVQVTRSGNSKGFVSVVLSAVDGSAVNGTDYTFASQTITFVPGQLNTIVTVPITNNMLVDGNRTFQLVLDESTLSQGAELGDVPVETVTIEDDDGVTYGFDPISVSVPEAQSSVVLTVTRSSSTGAGSVQYSIVPGTAQPGLDYAAATGTINFLPGESQKSITVTLLPDGVLEGNESFTVLLANPSNGVLGASNPATVTILDDDQPGTLQFRVDTITVAESQGQIAITVAREGGSGGTVSIPYATINGTAQAGTDFQGVAGDLVFGPGQTTAVIVLNLINDDEVESPESFSLALGVPTGGATLGSPSLVTIQVTDNDVDRRGPRITRVEPIMGRGGMTGLAISFDEPMNVQRLGLLLNYGGGLKTPGRDGRYGSADDGFVPIKSAVADPGGQRVVLTLRRALAAGAPFQLTVNPYAMDPLTPSLVDNAGNLLDGDSDGRPGGVYVNRMSVPRPPRRVVARAIGGANANLRLTTLSLRGPG